MMIQWLWEISKWVWMVEAIALPVVWIGYLLWRGPSLGGSSYDCYYQIKRPPPPQGSGGKLLLSPPPPPAPAHYRTSDEYTAAMKAYREMFIRPPENVRSDGSVSTNRGGDTFRDEEWHVEYGQPNIVRRPTQTVMK